MPFRNLCIQLTVLLMMYGFNILSAQSEILLETFRTPEETKVVPFLTGTETYVWIFLAPECPLCISYTTTLKKIYTEHNTAGVRIIGVFPGVKYSLEEIRKYLNQYQIPFITVLDPDKKITRFFDAEITPEVVVTDKQGKPVYQGRIDNWMYALGKKRKVITSYDLADVLLKRKKGEVVRFYKTEAIGCSIE